MRVFVVVAIVGVLLGSCSKGTGGSVTEADAKHALCADLLRGRAASNPQERETMNQRLLADAHLFDQAGDHATAKGIRALVDAIRTLDLSERDRYGRTVPFQHPRSGVCAVRIQGGGLQAFEGSLRRLSGSHRDHLPRYPPGVVSGSAHLVGDLRPSSGLGRGSARSRSSQSGRERSGRRS